jgi:Ca2+-binding EF-hand superfamily protein
MDFTEMDKDKDGKLSKEEFPEQARPMFETIDANGDGFVDKAENDAMMARMRQMRSQGGFGGPGGGAPGGGRAPGGSL